jgi:hypothetical protein
MKKLFFAIAISVTLLIAFSGCMSTKHLSQNDPYGELDHSNHGGGSYPSSGGGGHSGGCH